VTASASGKATRQSRTRKPAVTAPAAATKPAATPKAPAVAAKSPASAKAPAKPVAAKETTKPVTAKAPARTGTRKPAKAQPVVDLRADVVEVVEPAAVVDLNAQIAMAAYLMWEQGVPGDADSHWQAAERLVRA
jgi:hypothetical protein